MRFRRRRAPERGARAVQRSALTLRAHRDTFLKAGLVAAGAVAVTAGSAAISSLRRQLETSS
jgi:hypothetical protein